MTTTALKKVRYSASQVKKFAECERAWGWEYLEGIKRPGTEATELGKRVHSLLETWLREGVVPDPKTVEGKIAAPGLPYLPAPSPYLIVEKEFTFEFQGFAFRGFKDIEFDTTDRFWVVDHKTTKDFMWALTEEDLPHDIQAIIYAYHAMLKYDLDEVVLMWVYYRTKGKATAEPRTVVISRDQVEEGMELILEYVRQMSEFRKLHAKNKLTVLQMPYDARACGNYGGCHYKDKCNLTAKEKVKSAMANASKRKSFKDRKKARSKSKPKEDVGSAAEQNVVKPPKVNPPEEPDEETARSGLSTEEAPVEGKGRGKGKKEEEEAPAASSSRRSRRKKKDKDKKEEAPAAAKTEPEAAANVEPEASSSPGRLTGVDHQNAFIDIFRTAALGGEQRHFDTASKVWALYKKEFGV